MADDVTEIPDEQGADSEGKSGKKSKTKLLIIGLAALLLVGGGGSAAFYFLAGEKPATNAEEATAAEGSEAPVFLVTLDTFVVNLADPRGDRYMKATIRCVVDDAGLRDEIETDGVLKSRVRDKVLSTLSSRTFRDVTTPIGKESLRREILRELNGLLERDAITEVLFVEFVVQ